MSGALWDDDIQTFPIELERNGDYFIGYTYKVWAPGLSLNAPMGGTRTQYQRAGGHFSHFSHWVTCNAKKYGSIEAAKNVLYQETRDNFLQFLDGWKEVKDKEVCNGGVACSLLKLGSLEKTVTASPFHSGLHPDTICL